MTTPCPPLTFSVCTYNIWTTTRWPERRAALQAFVHRHRPDVLCLQEVQPESRAAIDEILGDTHDRVADPFEGWANEGQIYWNRSMFSAAEHGATDIGILEPLRRLFWVQLATDKGPSLLVSTAHFTWHGHTEARRLERNVRIPQARAAVEALDGMRRDGEPQLFMGDLNDTNEPLEVLRDGGLVDCFAALGRWTRATHPAQPTCGGAPQSIDWLMHRGSLRVLAAEVVDFHLDDLAPSDHKPVLAVYRLVHD